MTVGQEVVTRCHVGASCYTLECSYESCPSSCYRILPSKIVELLPAPAVLLMPAYFCRAHVQRISVLEWVFNNATIRLRRYVRDLRLVDLRVPSVLSRAVTLILCTCSNGHNGV